MRNITHKFDSLRTAVAESFVAMPPALRSIVESRNTEKGDALEIARVAAIMAAKKTWEILPLCHQIPITQLDVDYGFEADGIRVTVTAGAVAPTGVEMEAMTAASVCALTLYDVLKPYDDAVEVGGTKLLSKRGGKSDRGMRLTPPCTFYLAGSPAGLPAPAGALALVDAATDADVVLHLGDDVPEGRALDALTHALRTHTQRRLPTAAALETRAVSDGQRLHIHSHVPLEFLAVTLATVLPSAADLIVAHRAAREAT